MKLFTSRRPVVRGAYKANARKKEDSAQRKIDQDLFNIFSATASVHKIHSAQDEPGNAENGQDNAYNSFLHNSLLGFSCKQHASHLR